MIRRSLRHALIASLIVLGVLVGGVVSPEAQAYEVPQYDSMVSDYAGVLSDGFELALEQQLLTFAQATNGAEIAVVMINSLEGETVEDVSQQFFDTWQIGDADKDNGVLFLAAIDDRQMRLSTGYGAEPIITDTEASHIINRYVSPLFKTSDYQGGVSAAVGEIQDQFLAGEGFIDDGIVTGPTPDQVLAQTMGIATFMVMMIVVLTVVGAHLGRSKRWWPGGVIGFVLGLVLGSVLVGVFFGLLGLLLDYLFSRSYSKHGKKKDHWFWQSMHAMTTSSQTGWSGGSRSSGGFSGFGGGSSGGGGASGGW